MADRTNAALFAKIFNILAQVKREEDINPIKLARDIYSQAIFYNFSDDQMCCDEALKELGLAYVNSNGHVVYYRDYDFDERQLND